MSKPGSRDQAASSPTPSQPESVALATNIDEGGTLKIDKSVKVPPEVQNSVEAIFEDWLSKHPTQKRCSLRSAHKCVSTCNRQIDAFWVPEYEQKLACKSCYRARRACVVPTQDCTFVVLLLPPEVRATDAGAAADRYCIAADDSPPFRAVQGPWSTKAARKRDWMSMESES